MVNGVSYGDVIQGNGPTCWVMAGLASAGGRGIDLPSRIQYLGNGTYRVNGLLADGQGKMFQDVRFTGDLPTDARPAAEGESWVVLYQRAILQQAGRSWSDPGSGGCFHEPPLYVGRRYQVISPTNLWAIVDAIDEGRCVMAMIPAGNAEAIKPGLPTWHWYSVRN